ncbi:DUF86 domain-containing protein [Ornithinibacillus sp. 4-3]|uniref:DUF86 domain-containing protein n=1 Tax=Ornithinibacillus sp. 4-3 TaxID=3231488 RepID=A0AB39HMW7_9BACI
MYFVDRSKIEETLKYFDEILADIKKFSFTTRQEKLSLERMTHMIIESIIDVGNMMIDGFIMRDPGSYEDIIDILVDERVIPSTDEQAYKQIIELRQMIVREYLAINHEKLQSTLTKTQETIEKFSTYVSDYLENELGVANTFSNEEGR